MFFRDTAEFVDLIQFGQIVVTVCPVKDPIARLSIGVTLYKGQGRYPFENWLVFQIPYREDNWDSFT